MASKTVANVNIQVGAPLSGVKSGFRDARGLVHRFDDSMNKAGRGLRDFDRRRSTVTKGMATIGARLGQAAAAMAAFGTAAAAVRKTMAAINEQFEKIDAIAKLSDRIGFSTERLAGLRLAAELTGVELATLNQGLTTFVRRVGLFEQGAGAGKTAFEQLGFDADTLANLAPEEAFLQVAEAISRLPTAAQQGAAAFGAFGDSGQKFLTLLANGRKGIEEFQRQAEELGLVFDRDQAAQIEAVNDELTELKGALEGLVRAIAVDLAPVVIQLAEAMKALLGAIQAGREDPRVQRGARIGLDVLESGAFGGTAAAVARLPGDLSLLGRLGGLISSPEERQARIESRRLDEQQKKLLERIEQNTRGVKNIKQVSGL